jgi:hypothetical protein
VILLYGRLICELQIIDEIIMQMFSYLGPVEVIVFMDELYANSELLMNSLFKPFGISAN